MHFHQQKDPELQIIIHCEHGKGRTGTLFCAYLLYSGICNSIDDAVRYFEKNRGAEMKHAGQKQYLKYVEQVLTGQIRVPKRYILSKFELVNIP